MYLFWEVVEQSIPWDMQVLDSDENLTMGFGIRSMVNRCSHTGDRHFLTNYSQLSPYPERAHPYPDHYMPLIVAFGAAGEGAKGTVIHHSWSGDLSMAAYSFTI